MTTDGRVWTRVLYSLPLQERIAVHWYHNPSAEEVVAAFHLVNSQDFAEGHRRGLEQIANGQCITIEELRQRYAPSSPEVHQ